MYSCNVVSLSHLLILAALLLPPVVPLSLRPSPHPSWTPCPSLPLLLPPVVSSSSLLWSPCPSLPLLLPPVVSSSSLPWSPYPSSSSSLPWSPPPPSCGPLVPPSLSSSLPWSPPPLSCDPLVPPPPPPSHGPLLLSQRMVTAFLNGTTRGDWGMREIQATVGLIGLLANELDAESQEVSNIVKSSVDISLHPKAHTKWFSNPKNSLQHL